MDEPARIMLTNYIRMAISCSRTAAHTTSWVARASRCPVEPWENKNRSNGGKLHGNQEESRQEKETLSGRCSLEIPQSLSREAPLERLFRFRGGPVFQRNFREENFHCRCP